MSTTTVTCRFIWFERLAYVGTGTMRNSNATWDPRRHMYEELSMHPHQARRMMPGQQPGSDENVHQRGVCTDC